MSNLRERFADIIRMNTSETRRWKELESLTGIPAANWLAAVRNKQRPTAEMIEALARTWPQYAYWMVTGTSDARYGHLCADTWAAQQGKGRAFYPETEANAGASTAAYLALSIKLYAARYEFAPCIPPEQHAELELQHLKLDLERLSQIEAVAPMDKASLQAVIAARRGRVSDQEDLANPATLKDS
ncbi:hypothetical protein PEP31012_00642 [Pandoraea eparura]|uniref:Uncharacterized protein n=1 Tax=Pandoraea eparura TaxID=2508291 RepID=A0A5E4S845_9BURK|nr:hypothetical protein [Pandoraea eparura]VVD71760.1 hypothetical protein PEP31012_00642 [Pandoraea eparura]